MNLDLNKIYNENCLETMAKMPSRNAKKEFKEIFGVTPIELPETN